MKHVSLYPVHTILLLDDNSQIYKKIIKSLWKKYEINETTQLKLFLGMRIKH